jgi:carboxypeptidase family protein
MLRRSSFVALTVILLTVCNLHGQSTNATIIGRITDQSKAAIAGARVIATNVDTGAHQSISTGSEGMYSIGALIPGNYKLEVEKTGFKTIVKPELVLRVQDIVSVNFEMAIGSMSESITVTGGAPLIDTESAAVSTVIDRNFAENLPMNGRSFQTLIQLTPGVVLTPSTTYDSGQFSVSGQRATANYWMVDGVGANIGIGSLFVPTNGSAGTLSGFSAQGGTNSLVSVDAMQEFRIQTSTYAPEFGRTPGGQISIVTRSGTNQFHGVAFDYLRNDLFDANDWFADNKGQKKPEERQNDFGGTLGGPIIKDRAFFFFSYEGLRLRLPRIAQTTVPDVTARQNATPAQPYLNAYPVPNGPEATDVLGNPIPGAAEFNSSFSNRSTLDAYSLRLDKKVSDSLTVFGRYNYSPSGIVQRGAGGSYSLNTVTPSRIVIQTATAGATWILSPIIANDLRFNYSRTNASSYYYLDRFGGAIPVSSLQFPSPYTSRSGNLSFGILSLLNSYIVSGPNLLNVQRQINIADNLSLQKGRHSVKLGVDFRRLSPIYNPAAYNQYLNFSDVPSALAGNLAYSEAAANVGAQLLFHNLSVYVQDAWRFRSRLTVTYGLRWDVDFAPSSANSVNIAAVTDFNDLPNLALAPNGTPPFKTPYANFAPRLGMAYELRQNQDWQTVLRGGTGVFFDLATQEAGSGLFGNYPFGTFKFNFGGTLPLDPATAAPLPLTPASLTSGTLHAFDPHLQLPYTLEWNVAIEQGLGRQQTVAASYVGSAGRRLIQSRDVFSPNVRFGSVLLTGNTATSDYDALQIQFERRLSQGLQVLSSYSWAHSIDTASAGSVFGNVANAFVSGSDRNINRGPSDFDTRQTFSAGFTYAVPTPKMSSLMKWIARDWSLQNTIQARSALPVNVYEQNFYQIRNNYTQIRPDLKPGIPVYLSGRQYPGGKIFNSAMNQGGPGCTGPFCPPPTDINGNPLRQGNLGRNALRGFGATQWDCAIHRDFPIHESIELQFRAEMFNLLNHPNFSQPLGAIGNPQFGQSTQMLGQGLSGGNVGGGGFSPLYQIGGPRSMQFALKLRF